MYIIHTLSMTELVSNSQLIWLNQNPSVGLWGSLSESQNWWWYLWVLTQSIGFPCITKKPKHEERDRKKKEWRKVLKKQNSPEEPGPHNRQRSIQAIWEAWNSCEKGSYGKKEWYQKGQWQYREPQPPKKLANWNGMEQRRKGDALPTQFQQCQNPKSSIFCQRKLSSLSSPQPLTTKSFCVSMPLPPWNLLQMQHWHWLWLSLPNYR